MKILQLSDLHFTPEPGSRIYGSDPFTSLEGALERAFGGAESPELMIVTGDLTEDGSSGSYRRLREALRACDVPIFVVPGNHDSRKQIVQELCGDRIAWQRATDAADWRIVFLDSKVAREGYGGLGAEELATLDDELRAHPTRPFLVALHHSVVPPCPARGCQLEDAAALVARLARHEARCAVVAGHAHVPIQQEQDGVALFTGPSVCAAARHSSDPSLVEAGFWASHSFEPELHGFQLLELGGAGAVANEVVEFRDSDAI